MKEPYCKICGGQHYKTFCFILPKKPTKRKNRKNIFSDKTRSNVTRSRPVLIREADKLFSIYIRRRHSIEGYSRCITCGFKDEWSNLQNGHYISRRFLSLRWDERNCHPQCNNCNVILGGNLEVYKLELIKLYGNEIIETLKLELSNRRKISNIDIKNIINEYREKIKTIS